MTERSLNCLLVHPRFNSSSFWNYKKTCEITGASYPATPLGLATVAALLPAAWNIKLIDCNVEELTELDIDWADLVLSGGMIAQQVEHRKLVERLKEKKKVHIVGGPDPTSSPQLYDEAQYLVLGEAELTLPEFLADFSVGKAKHIYTAGERRADMAKSPIPRFDLFKFKKYLHVGIQFARGCPFKCEFCDIIELFGRVPRVKTTEQLLVEIQRLYDLGYRGHIDLVDDNFIGNKKAVRSLLPQLKTWLEKNNWPFEFSTEASMNLVDDEELMTMMQEVGFVSIFMGIESPDEAVLIGTQKLQNTRRSIADSVHKVFRHGMIVNAGYIVGFDSEKGSVAQSILKCIDETATPIAMAGLLFALPNTQLSRRLTTEGRLMEGSEKVAADSGDQCVVGLNFNTLRPKHEILADYRQIIAEAYSPAKYFGRVLRFALMMDCSKKRLKIPLVQKLRDLRNFSRIVRGVGIGSHRRHFWHVFWEVITKNPKALRYAVAVMALYLHFGPFSEYITTRIDKQILMAGGLGFEPR